MKLSIEEAKNMKVVDLKEALKKRGAPSTGKKEELYNRLVKILELEEKEEGSQPALAQSFGSDVLSPEKKVDAVEDVTDTKLALVSDHSASSTTIEETIAVVAAVEPLSAEDKVIDHDELIIETQSSVSQKVEVIVSEFDQEKPTSGELKDEIVQSVLSNIPASSAVTVPVDNDKSISDELSNEIVQTVSNTPASNAVPVPAASTEISALLGDNSVEEEDDEQRELREVEERKLREAVKLSMARQAVKKSMGSNASGSDSSIPPARSSNLKSTSSLSSSKLKSNNLSVSSDDDTVPMSIHAHDSSSLSATTPLSLDTTAVPSYDVTDQSTPVYVSAVSGTSSRTDVQRSVRPAPVVVSKSAAVNPVSRFLRIDNFQRPLKLESLQTWLQNRLNHSVPLENIWINSIKSHCYVTFETEAEAVACRESVNGELWTSSSAIPLMADFTLVSAQEAGTAPEAQLKPGTWLQKALASTPREKTPLAATAVAARGQDFADSSHVSDRGTGVTGNTSAESTATNTVIPNSKPAEYQTRKLSVGGGAGGVMMGVLRNAATSAANSTRTGDRQPRVDGNEETGFSTRRNRGGESVGGSGQGGGGASKRGRDADGDEQSRYTKSARNDTVPDLRNTQKSVDPGPTLEDLFRKTTTKPFLYWLPVSDDEVARRRSMRSK